MILRHSIGTERKELQGSCARPLCGGEKSLWQREGGCGETLMKKTLPRKVGIVFLLPVTKKTRECWMDGDALVEWSREWRVSPGLLVTHMRQKKKMLLLTREQLAFSSPFWPFSSEIAHTCSSEVSSLTFYGCLTLVSFLPGPVVAILLNSEYLIHVINQTQKRLYIFQRYPLCLVILVFSLTLSYGHRLQTNSSTRLPASWASAGRVLGGLRCWAVVNLSWGGFWSSALMW